MCVIPFGVGGVYSASVIADQEAPVDSHGRVADILYADELGVLLAVVLVTMSL